jgi:hypothetical protein
MVTKLDTPLRRALSIDGKPYVLTITPTGFLLTEKGRRKGFEMDWMSFVSGDAALATGLAASLANAPSARKGAAAGRSQTSSDTSKRKLSDLRRVK